MKAEKEPAVSIIDRRRVLETFAAYVKNYNDEDPKIRLKIEHTYRVAAHAETIAKSIHLSEEDVDIAWLCGMLHDIGRFEQVTRYGTFQDDLSENHAYLGSRILFGKEINGDPCRDIIPGGNRLIEKFIDSDAMLYDLLQTAVYYHSDYAIPENLTERQSMFCNILRDADKIDILKVNNDYPMEEIYNTTTEVLKTDGVSEEVKECFRQRETVLRKQRITVVDHLVGHICLVFDLVYPKSLWIVKEQGYLDRLLNFESENAKTREWFAYMREDMRKYLQAEEES